MPLWMSFFIWAVTWNALSAEVRTCAGSSAFKQKLPVQMPRFWIPYALVRFSFSWMPCSFQSFSFLQLITSRCFLIAGMMVIGLEYGLSKSSLTIVWYWIWFCDQKLFDVHNPIGSVSSGLERIVVPATPELFGVWWEPHLVHGGGLKAWHTTSLCHVCCYVHVLLCCYACCTLFCACTVGAHALYACFCLSSSCSLFSRCCLGGSNNIKLIRVCELLATGDNSGDEDLGVYPQWQRGHCRFLTHQARL